MTAFHNAPSPSPSLSSPTSPSSLPVPLSERPPRWGFGWLGFWLGWPVAVWVGYVLLLVPAAGKPAISNTSVAAVIGLVLLVLQPIALAAYMAERRRNAVHGALWVGAFAVVATGIFVGLWRGGMPEWGWLLAQIGWWSGWGGMWLMLILGGRRISVPASVMQIAVGFSAAVWCTSIFWLDPYLHTAANRPDFADVLTRTIRFSPLQGYLGSVLDLHIFRQGRMYLNPDGAPLSVIGEYLGVVREWPSAAELTAQWLFIGFAGWLGAYVAAWVSHWRRPRLASAAPRFFGTKPKPKPPSVSPIGGPNHGAERATEL